MYTHHTNLDVTAVPGEMILYLTDGTVETVPPYAMAGMVPLPKKIDYWRFVGYLYSRDANLKQMVENEASRMFRESLSDPKRKRRAKGSYLFRLQAFVSVTGLPLKYFFYRFAAALRRAYVVDTFAMKYAWRHWSKSFNPGTLDRITKRLPLLKQLHADGLAHLEPFAIWQGYSPEKARKVFGKGLWRTLSANSNSRNTLIAKLLDDIVSTFPRHAGEANEDEIKTGARYLSTLPSTVLAAFESSKALHGTYRGASVADTVTYERLLAIKESRTWKETCSFLLDGVAVEFNADPPQRAIVRMAEVVDAYVGVSHKAKPLTIQQIARRHHDVMEATRRAAELRREGLLDVKLDPIELHKGDISAFRITTYEEILNESDAMHHCVSAYWGQVADEHSVIFSINKEGKHVATAEVAWAFPAHEDAPTWRLNQVRGPCNAVVDADIKKFADWLPKQVSKYLKLPTQPTGGADCQL